MITPMPGPARRPLPTLGRRGEGWVLIQLALIAAVFLSAFAGRGWSGAAGIVAYAASGALLALGSWMAIAGAATLGKALTPFPAPKGQDAVVSTGVYRLVRHPIYGGGLLVSLGWTILFATVPGLVLTIVLAVFLDLKSRREEEWLIERLRGYEAYRRATPHRLVPFLY
jgi:protein-S-isoprenylcysteine O-methyltransferase Ste14